LSFLTLLIPQAATILGTALNQVILPDIIKSLSNPSVAQDSNPNNAEQTATINAVVDAINNGKLPSPTI
jgi:hypothetical protein